MPRVFISYVKENADTVKRFATALRKYDIEVWIDSEQIQPGSRWSGKIREGIENGDFFIACFSEEYCSRHKTYMNEELTLAIDQLRLRPTDRTGPGTVKVVVQ